MRILFLALDTDIGGFAGDVVHVRAIAKAFADLGHEVLLLVGDGPEDFKFPNVTVKIIKKRFSGIFRFLDDIRAALVGIRWLGVSSSDCLIYERRFSCKVGVLIKTFARCPLGVEINGLIDDEAHAQGERQKKTRAWSLLHADRIIAVAPGLAHALSERYGVNHKKISVVSNGVDVDLFYPMDSKSARITCGFESTNKIVLFVGNFVEWYDLSLLIRSFKIISASIKEARLVLVGDGRLTNSIRMQIKDLGLEERVVLTGRMAHGKIPQFISASDVCVAPFTREVNENIDLSPMKLFEYLAVARPVVASDIGGLDRYAENIPSLYLVKIEDDEAFALKIIELLENPNEEKSNIGADVIRNQYTWQQAATKILEYMDL